MVNPPVDYLRAAEATIPSFHFRTGRFALLPSRVAPKAPTNGFGFPQPGPQSPSPALATTKHYFVDDTTWANIVDHGEFDDIVIGSGFCALAYVDKALKLDPFRKILILERGGFWLPEHFQNMPLPFKLVLGGPSETFPFQLSSKTANDAVKFVHGSCPFFGGRSTFWSAWSPRPSRSLMRKFPESLILTTEADGFWEAAEALLNVTKANDMFKSPVFGKKLQDEIFKRLSDGIRKEKILGAQSVEHAPLAVGRKTSVAEEIEFDKFSTPGPLLAIYERQRRLSKEGEGNPLMIAIDTIAERFETDPDDPKHRPTVLHTSRGDLCFPNCKTNIVLAAGVFPSTTFLMNSIPQQLKGRAGTRVSGHFLSHITARYPIPESENAPSHLQIGAHYLAGMDSDTELQYHIQITAIHSPRPKTDAEDAGRLCPDYAAAATFEQLEGSTRHIVLVCAALGELDENNPDSWVRQNTNDPDLTTNIRVQMLLNDEAKKLWKLMDDATYNAIDVMAGDKTKNIEYWHDDIDGREPTGSLNEKVTKVLAGGWKSYKPSTDMIHVPGLVHETSTLYMSDNLEADKGASVGSDYQPRDCNNVYVTGGAIFPSSGSWNPTLTMCGLAQDLAKKVHQKK